MIEKGVGIELHIKWKLFLEVINNVQEIFFMLCSESRRTIYL